MLALEVSEETGTTAASTTFFAQLAESGVRVSLDDFGTGFASLESLGGWPIDELKLDRSIVRPVVASASFRAIVATTVDLAHQLGIRVVAEGIESDAISSDAQGPALRHRPGILPRPPHGRRRLHRMDARPHPPHPAPGYHPLPAGQPRWPPGTAQRRRAPPGRASGTAGQELASGTAGRAARAVRRAVQPVGGGALAAAVTMMVAYGLWQVFRWGGREHQALIGDLAFIPVNGAAALLAWRASRRADLGRATCRAWRLLAVALLLYMLGDLLQLVYEVGLHRRAYPTWADAAYLSFYPVALWASSPSRSAAGPDRSGCGCCWTRGWCSPAGRC